MHRSWKMGAHSYRGLRNDRSKRQASKLYKGIKKEDLTEVYKELENEEPIETLSIDNPLN